MMGDDNQEFGIRYLNNREHLGFGGKKGVKKWTVSFFIPGEFQFYLNIFFEIHR